MQRVGYFFIKQTIRIRGTPAFVMAKSGCNFSCSRDIRVAYTKKRMRFGFLNHDSWLRPWFQVLFTIHSQLLRLQLHPRNSDIDGVSPQPRISFRVFENLRSYFIFLKENKSTPFFEIFAEFSWH